MAASDVWGSQWEPDSDDYVDWSSQGYVHDRDRNGGSGGTGMSMGFGSVLNGSKPEPEYDPLTDEDGVILDAEEVRTALANVEQSILNIDRDVRTIPDPAEQALRAQELLDRYESMRKDYEDHLKWLAKTEAARLEKIGARPFQMPTDEGNVEATAMIDEIVAEYEEGLQALKDRVGERMRKGLDELAEKGLKAPVVARDALYEELVRQEVIEAWEPMEF